MTVRFWHAAAFAGLCLAPAGLGDDASRLLRIDHYVQVVTAGIPPTFEIHAWRPSGGETA